AGGEHAAVNLGDLVDERGRPRYAPQQTAALQPIGEAHQVTVGLHAKPLALCRATVFARAQSPAGRATLWLLHDHEPTMTLPPAIPRVLRLMPTALAELV